MNPWLEILESSAKESLLITVIDVPVSMGAGFFLAISPFDVLGFVLLLESVVLMLIGGALEMGGTASVRKLQSFITRRKFEWSGESYRKSQARGALYTIIGVIFFVEALALGLATVVY